MEFERPQEDAVLAPRSIPDHDGNYDIDGVSFVEGWGVIVASDAIGNVFSPWMTSIHRSLDVWFTIGLSAS